MSVFKSSTSTSEITNTPAITRALATLDVVLDMRNPVHVVLSNDGKRVAIVVSERAPDEQKKRQRIWLAETDGSKEAHPLISGKRDETSPCWSPDGKQLAFVTQAEGEKEKPQLHIISAEGGEAKLICKLPNGVSNLAWSPDGSRISFLSLEGEEPKSDPKVLAPARYQRLWTVRAEQALPEAVTPRDIMVMEYVWSPDSQSLALYYAHGPEENDWYHGQIGTVAASGSAVRQLTSLKLPARALAWSPDGTQIAFLSGSWSDPGRGVSDIYAVTLATQQVRNLTPGIDGSPAWCSWFPDGRHLLFAMVKHVTHQIGLLDSQDGTIRLLDTDFVMQDDQPSLWLTPNHLSCATVHSGAQLPRDVWTGNLILEDNLPTRIEWRQLTHLNTLAVEVLPRVQSERIRYKSEDGQLVDGLFTVPPIAQAGELPPLYVDVHGGPSGAECDYWASWDQIFLAAGYAVFRPNYRGSWGQGMAFADAVLGDMGGKDLQDILSGVEYLVREGKVDGNRVAIGGWSNGGYLAAWAVTQTDRFKAAMMGAGISDWLNMHAQTNTPDADSMLMAADPLEHPEAYYRASPITFAGRVKTPTLILHGEEDPCVPVAQAYAFYRALRERNVPVECVIYPRAGHGVSERDHVRDTTERQLRWFEAYVM
ncbi:alpha/beta hydrolase family protein [Dictyobacter arantiisoli]|uniref:Peptidase n=1 Tax=Dictyobacter arantiisoli TaxID=2014874 RepID=A0A5A5TEE6_9CHLR|nr:S9 family peptidase [Dictyobacter arantiisoli]GCF09930.1 peptidase [Dictyobacter arantiisoli]